MALMPDPMEALVSLQAIVRRGPQVMQREGLKVQAAERAPGVQVILDTPLGNTRITYAKIEQGRVKALAIFVHHDPIDGIPTFNIGYAVPEFYRGRGWGADIVEQAIQEMRLGLGRKGVPRFYVEAVVGVDKIPSHRVAEKVISSSPISSTDSFTELPVKAYTRLVEC
jgi:hypothetical protein